VYARRITELWGGLRVSADLRGLGKSFDGLSPTGWSAAATLLHAPSCDKVIAVHALAPMTQNSTAVDDDDAEAANWARSVLTFDVDAHAAAQGNWLLGYEQLSQGSFRGELTMVQFEGLRLFGERTNLALRQRGHLGDSVYGFAMSVHAPSPVYFNGQKVGPDAIMCGRGHQLDLVVPVNHGLIAIVVERSLLNPLWELMYHKPLAGWLEHQLVLEASSASADALRQRHLQALQQSLALAQQYPDPSGLRQLRDEILIEWIEALPPSVDTSELDTLERRKRLVDKACELMLASPDEPLSILQVCSLVGASRRKLNYCFQDVLGISPTQYLRALRLNGVRRGLKNASGSATVQDVAARWGFWHLGQFSLDYKKQFLELPSETLARAKKNRD
jgi:AraC family transcriptional regulator, ethanolamine operon transcriptional activator